MTLTLGTKLGTFEITGHLSKSGMAEVYSARDCTRFAGRIRRERTFDILKRPCTQTGSQSSECVVWWTETVKVFSA